MYIIYVCHYTRSQTLCCWMSRPTTYFKNSWRFSIPWLQIYQLCENLGLATPFCISESLIFSSVFQFRFLAYMLDLNWRSRNLYFWHTQFWNQNQKDGWPRFKRKTSKWRLKNCSKHSKHTINMVKYENLWKSLSGYASNTAYNRPMWHFKYSLGLLRH